MRAEARALRGFFFVSPLLIFLRFLFLLRERAAGPRGLMPGFSGQNYKATSVVEIIAFSRMIFNLPLRLRGAHLSEDYRARALGLSRASHPRPPSAAGPPRSTPSAAAPLPPLRKLAGPLGIEAARAVIRADSPLGVTADLWEKRTPRAICRLALRVRALARLFGFMNWNIRRYVRTHSLIIPSPAAPLHIVRAHTTGDFHF